MQVNVQRLAGRLRILAVAVFVLSVRGPSLHADVGLLLGEAWGGGMPAWTSSGHSAVYLSRLCPETPVKLRLCAADEAGSVISTYNGFSEDQNFEWNAVPLSLFLYGVAHERDRPLLAWPALLRLLQDDVRESYLAGICKTASCAADLNAHWREMFASTFVRDIYLFQARTTLQQDLALMAHLNGKANVSHYSGVSNNCADFAAAVLNFYFPGSARADHVNDFGMTSPKAISKSFTHYGHRHPELEFRVFRFSQVGGTYVPSHDTRKGTEVLFRSKRWLLPMLLRSHELALFAASYTLTGRFNPERELRRHPGKDNFFLRDQAGMERLATQAAPMEPAALADLVNLPIIKEQANSREAILGGAAKWKAYRKALRELTDEAVSKELIQERNSLRKVVKELGGRGEPSVDSGGAAWLELTIEGVPRRVGVAASNVNSPGSDPELAYLIMLARVDEMLQRPAKNRELLPQFERDWQLLMEARGRLWPDATRIAGDGSFIPAGRGEVAGR